MDQRGQQVLHYQSLQLNQVSLVDLPRPETQVIRSVQQFRWLQFLRVILVILKVQQGL